MDLALNNLQTLICHKTQPTNQNEMYKKKTTTKKQEEEEKSHPVNEAWSTLYLLKRGNAS